MGIGRKMVSNTFYFFLDWFFLSLFSFLFWFVAGKTLSPPDYGVVLTSINFAVLISTFGVLGMTGALPKLIPELVGKKDTRSIYSMVKMAFKPVFIFLLISSIILFIFTNVFSSFLKVSYYAFLISISSMIFLTIHSFFGSVLYGMQRMKKYFITDFFAVLLKLMIAIFLAFLGLDYLGFLIAYSLSYFFLMFFRIDSKYFKAKKTKMAYSDLLYYSVPGLISALASAVILYTPGIILTILQNLRTTGIFGVAFTLSNLVSVLPTLLSSASFPIFSGLSVRKRTMHRQNHLISLVYRYTLFIIFPVAILFLVFPNYAVLFFSTSEYLEAINYFPILIPGALIYGVSGIFLSSIYAIGKPKIQRNILVATALIFLAMSIPLTRYLSAIGLSMSFLISSLVLYILSLFYLRKYLDLTFFLKDISKVLFSSIAMAAIFLFLRPFIPSFFYAIIISIPVIFIYLILLLILKFYRVEDIKSLEYLAEKLPKRLSRYAISFIKILSKFV